MMDINKIKGILDAIEAESVQPQPSHANLARLTGMAFKEILDFLDTLCKGVMPLLARKLVSGDLEPANPPAQELSVVLPDPAPAPEQPESTENQESQQTEAKPEEPPAA